MNNKLLRSELKKIVKECLVEILAEGIGVDSKPAENKQIFQKRSVAKPKKEKKFKLKESFKTDITGDAVLNELLADTAKSTLHEQMSAEGNGRHQMLDSKGGDAASKIAAEHTPEEMFGNETTDKWASLAFS